MRRVNQTTLLVFLVAILATTLAAQNSVRTFEFAESALIEVNNPYGRVAVVSSENPEEKKVRLKVFSNASLADNEVKMSGAKSHLEISFAPTNPRARIDVELSVPMRARLRVKTKDGEVRISGNIASAEVETETGTISTDIPLDSVRYDFLWTASRPRFLSDKELSDPKEKSAGRFLISGNVSEPKSEAQRTAEEISIDSENRDSALDETNPASTSKESKKRKKDKSKKIEQDSGPIAITFTTARGIILFNVSPSEVSSDLRERPLTEAAKAIIRSGDGLLMTAIRRTSPKYFSDYARTLPPRRNEPFLGQKAQPNTKTTATIRRALVKITDANNRAVAGLTKEDFKLFEKSSPREILEVEKTTAPFNLVLLLDVSGSVENYSDFIRKAARDFIKTVEKQDRIAIVAFNEDTKTLSGFSTDHSLLSRSLDSLNAGGGTAFYDAVAYTLAETLRPLRGERSAIVILTDGDDNHSFLSAEALLGSIQESGALIYPLYVPSGLIAAAKTADPRQTIDPLRSRYMSLSSRAEGEGARLAQTSGGVYYSIGRLTDIQKAYDDIVVQLRTAYSITFRSTSGETSGRVSPRLKVETTRTGVFANVSSVVDVSPEQSAKYAPKVVIQPEPDDGVIRGELDVVEYKTSLGKPLREIAWKNFNINNAPPAFVLADGENKIALSRWVSPKRTRSYPYERVYNTLAFPKRAAVIPVIKDEGANGDRDFLQWDTFSLMSLLNVYVIPAYYADAQPAASNGKITEQNFDNVYVNEKLAALKSFEGTALDWNLSQLQDFSSLIEKAKESYRAISKLTGVALHGEEGIDDFAARIKGDLLEFMRVSRLKAHDAQNREFQTTQPKEALTSDTKARVTISDASGGKYFFTCDETKFEGKTLTLMEAKHSKNAKFPSQSDIKDGLLKMMLYTNLKNVRRGNESLVLKAALRLSAGRLEGSINSDSPAADFDSFMSKNLLTKSEKDFFAQLFAEARENHFQIILEHADNPR